VAQSSAITIRVVEGDRAINSIKLRRGHEAVVQVLDTKGEPVSGASVTFLLPASGPGGWFGENDLSQTVQTDRRGMAATHGLKPNRLEGQFRIRVTTSLQGEGAAATLVQTNAEPVVKSKNSRWIVIAVVVGAAATGGAVAAMHGGQSQSGAGASTGSTGGSMIVAGSPAFGPPR
jgi:hypothetical protein